MNESVLIRPEWEALLREETASAERLGMLTQQQLEVIFEAGWFRMFLPESLGGLAFALPAALRLEEALARIDGSLGWTVTLCAGATLFAGFMEQGMAAEFLANPHACFGGSGAATGVAEETGGGYRISGFWKYATGAPHLSAFTANCRLRRNGADISDEKGAPAIRAFVFHADEVRVHHDWQTMGLRATAGHAFEVKDLWVPASRAFDIMPEAATLPDPIFQYPFLPFAEATLAVNGAGMAWHFLDACAAIFETKAARNGHRDFYDSLLRQAEESFEEQRMTFYRVADASWKECVKRGYCRAETLNDLSRESRTLAHCARGLATKLFPYCGMAAIRPETEINRVWRDLFTASQHSLLNPAG